jgi:hypothetical protein
MVAEYTTQGESFLPGKPRQWSETRILTRGLVSNYDITPDGRRLIGFPRPQAELAESGSVHVTFLLNFFEEVKRRLPIQ